MNRFLWALSGCLFFVCLPWACSSSSSTPSPAPVVCQAGTVNCGNGCAVFSSDVANCGACGMACPAGQACTNSACAACAAGQQLCNGACVAAGTTCVVGAAGSGNGPGIGAGGAGPGGVAAGAGPSAGGTTGPGASAGAGGSPPVGTGGVKGGAGATSAGGAAAVPQPVALSCMVDGATVSVPAADVISDFRTDETMYAVGTRGGTAWYAYGAEDTAAALGKSTPGATGNAFAVDATTVGPCNSGGSLKVSSPGNSGATGWGVGFGVNMMQDVGTTMKKDKFDAKAAGYTGVGFFMKCQAETDFFYFKTVDAPNDADVPTPVCSYMGNGTICNQYGQKNTTNLTSWTYHKIYFADTLQDWDGGTVTNGINASQLTAFQVQVNTQYTRDGSARIANPFTCWIDDVHFVKDVPPSASVAPKACTAATAANAAPGGYYTMGNKIMDCKTGTQKIFHGVARPSFEWDRAGWNVNYQDLARIAALKSNVVRFSLNQQFWLDPAKGALYQAYVDRAVKWTLSLGMDVILDLHWLTTAGQTAITDNNSPTFWKQVATKYKGDGRVIFELFNEPYCDAGTWKTAMQGLYNAVRNDAGAKNLVLMGGLDYAYQLSQVVPGSIITGTNIAYVTHPYSFKAPDAASWDKAFGNLAASYPIVATEFGQANTTPGGSLACNGSIYTAMLDYFKTKQIGWTGWAWFVDRGIKDPAQTCGFPQLITSYSGATNAGGTAVKAAF